MSTLSHWMYPLAGFYAAIGLLILRLTRRSTCRVCLLRGECPNRPLTGSPACATKQTAQSATSTDDAGGAAICTGASTYARPVVHLRYFSRPCSSLPRGFGIPSLREPYGNLIRSRVQNRGLPVFTGSSSTAGVRKKDTRERHLSMT